MNTLVPIGPIGPIEKVYFSVPFHEKELAKRNGAKWDNKMKSWWFSKDLITDFVKRKWTITDDVSNRLKRKHVVHTVNKPETETEPKITSTTNNVTDENITKMPENEVVLMASETVQKFRENFEGEKILRGWFDGGSRGNPGICGYGSVLRMGNGKKIGVRMGAKRKGTNNDAEYMGMISLLEMIEERLNDEMGTETGVGPIVLGGLKLTPEEKQRNVSADYTVKIEIYGDSNLVIKQVAGEWKTHQESTKEYCGRAQNILDRIRKNKNVISVILEQIDRESNAEADEYANTAMDTIST